MQQQNELEMHDFIYPRRRYYGQFKPEYLVYNANLQEFVQRVSYICNLQTRGKLSVEESYHRINALWEQLKCSYCELSVGSDNEAGMEGNN